MTGRSQCGCGARDDNARPLHALSDATGWGGGLHAEVDAAGLRSGSMTPPETPPVAVARDTAAVDEASAKTLPPATRD